MLAQKGMTWMATFKVGEDEVTQVIHGHIGKEIADYLIILPEVWGVKKSDVVLVERWQEPKIDVQGFKNKCGHDAKVMTSING